MWFSVLWVRCTLSNPKPQTLSLQPQTLNPEALNPKPQTLNPVKIKKKHEHNAFNPFKASIFLLGGSGGLS